MDLSVTRTEPDKGSLRDDVCCGKDGVTSRSGPSNSRPGTLGSREAVNVAKFSLELRVAIRVVVDGVSKVKLSSQLKCVELMKGRSEAISKPTQR